jgi:hypothetical protein
VAGVCVGWHSKDEMFKVSMIRRHSSHEILVKQLSLQNGEDDRALVER